MLKRTCALLVLVAMLSVPALAADWNVDKAHSEMEFAVSHMVISTVRGQFNDFSGTISGFDGEQLKGASVTVTAQTASIDTDNADRDQHLRSADFFAAEEYPTLKFESREVIPGEGNSFQLVGDLTIRGVTKEVTFDGTYKGTVDDPWGNTRAAFSAETEINRKDYNIDWNKTLDAGGLVVGDNVTIELQIQAIKQQPDQG
ncbi:hypothetical protein GF420_11580 [candidate division GN15 bacterium]|nr:hypothetical protein [candidate division GN15 bacterium]